MVRSRLLSNTPMPFYLGACLLIGLGWLVTAEAFDPRYQRSWTNVEGGEELEGSYDERARDLQNWLRQRDAQRRDEWGNDVVTPENPALRSTPGYYRERNYDAQGYRRLNENTRFRLRGEEGWGLGDDGHAGTLRRAGQNPEDDQVQEGDVSDADTVDARPSHRHKRRHSSHRKRRHR